MEKIKKIIQKKKSAKMLGIICVLIIILSGCTAKGSTDSSNQYGDSIATIDSLAYFWKTLGNDSAKISAVKDNHIVSECIIRGPFVGAKQYDDGEIYIVCRNEQLCWFDVRNFPDKLDLLTDEDLEDYDISHENADTIINLLVYNDTINDDKQEILYSIGGCHDVPLPIVMLGFENRCWAKGCNS